MANQLQVTKTVTDQGIEILASLVDGSDLPKDIFLYLNTGTTTLGEYQGVTSVSQFGRFQVWTGTAVTPFGNKYVRSNQAKILITDGTDPDSVVQDLLSSLKTLAAGYNAQKQTTQIYGF